MKSTKYPVGYEEEWNDCYFVKCADTNPNHTDGYWGIYHIKEDRVLVGLERQNKKRSFLAHKMKQKKASKLELIAETYEETTLTIEEMDDMDTMIRYYDPIALPINSFSTLCAGVPAKQNKAYPTPCKMEKPMRIDVSPKPMEVQKMDYLTERLYSTMYEKENALPQAFGMIDDDRPSTFEDLMARLDAGKFTIKEDDKKKRNYGGPLAYVRWRDPAVKEDTAGYEAAQKALAKASTEAKDAIMIKSPEDGLAALKEFESKTFH